MCRWGCSGLGRGCCRVFGCAWSPRRGPSTGGYIVRSYMLASTVVFSSSFPCILLLCLALSCPHMQLAEGTSQASKGIILKPT